MRVVFNIMSDPEFTKLRASMDRLDRIEKEIMEEYVDWHDQDTALELVNVLREKADALHEKVSTRILGNAVVKSLHTVIITKQISKQAIKVN